MGSLLVTGATGFLGRHLLRRLWDREGPRLRVLATRTPRWLSVLGVEVIEGSVTDPDACRRAAAGADEIFHLAGLVSRDPADQHRMYEVHVEGTRALFQAAREAGVRRAVLCSSSGTIAITDDGTVVPDETFARPMPIVARFPYYLSKAVQEDVAREISDGAFELVTVQPSLVLGPGDDRLSSTLDVQAFLDGHVPVLPPGGLSVVDVRDTADALVAAMERGRPGERYLLGAANWTFESFFGRIARLADRPVPRLKVGAKAMKWAGIAMDTAYRHFGRTPPVDKVSAEMSTYFWYLDASRAKAELGFAPRDPGETLHDTVQFLRSGAEATA